jgi:hypothetical protein
MRIVIVSDTHTRHEELGIVTGDVLMHCGEKERVRTEPRSDPNVSDSH